MKLLSLAIALAILIVSASAVTYTGQKIRPNQINNSLDFPSINMDDGANITLDNGSLIGYDANSADAFIWPGATNTVKDRNGTVVNSSTSGSAVIKYAIDNYHNIYIMDGIYGITTSITATDLDFLLQGVGNVTLFRDGLENAPFFTLDSGDPRLKNLKLYGNGGELVGVDGIEVENLALGTTIADDLLIQNFEKGINITDKVYITRFLNCYTRYCTIGLNILSSTNQNNANIFESCSFSWNDYGVAIFGNNHGNRILNSDIEFNEKLGVLICNDAADDKFPRGNRIIGCWIEDDSQMILINRTGSYVGPQSNIIDGNHFVSLADNTTALNISMGNYNVFRGNDLEQMAYNAKLLSSGDTYHSVFSENIATAYWTKWYINDDGDSYNHDNYPDLVAF